MRRPIYTIKNPAILKRMRRRLSIRKRIIGTSKRPRICVNRSNKHLVVQVIDDQKGETLFSIQTFGKNKVKGASNTKEGAKKLGEQMAKSFKSHKIENAVFDRAGYKYHGVIAALVESIREKGIQV